MSERVKRPNKKLTPKEEREDFVCAIMQSGGGGPLVEGLINAFHKLYSIKEDHKALGRELGKRP